MLVLREGPSSEEEKEEEDCNEAPAEAKAIEDFVKTHRLVQRFDKSAVERVCVAQFSCTFHSSIAVTENHQVFIWGRRMQSILYDPLEALCAERVLAAPKYVPSMEIPIEVG